MFELINRAAGLCRKCFESDPNQKRTADMMAVDARRTALATFQACHLFAFAVQLLTLPTEAARLLCGLGRILSQVIGHDRVRAVGRHRHPEELHRMIFREAFDLDPLPVCQFGSTPLQRVYPPEGVSTAGIIHLAMVLERAIGALVERLDAHQQVFGRVPCVHQHCLEGELFVVDDVRQHLAHVIELAFAIAVGIVDAVVNQPKLIRGGIDIYARLRLALLDEDSQPVQVPTPTGDQPFELRAEFEVGRPAGLRVGTPLDVAMAINIAPIALRPNSRYIWRYFINGRSEDDWQVGFSTVQPQPQLQPPQAP